MTDPHDPSHVTSPVHAEKIPAPDDSGPTTDPGRVHWSKVVADVVKKEIDTHENQARGRYDTILGHFAEQNKWRASMERRMWSIETSGVPLLATVLLVAVNVWLGAHTYLEYRQMQIELQRIEMLRESPVVRAMKP